MVSLGKHRQCQIFQVNQRDIESRMPTGAIAAPLGNRKTDATFANTGDHYA